jgi:hypothetical protein
MAVHAALGSKGEHAMLRSTKSILGYTLQASDGQIGRCKDFLFDDQTWTVRYLVADTGKWIPKRKVLISPISVAGAQWKDHTVQVRLTRQQVADAPPLESDAPVSARHEVDLSRYYAYPYYWLGDGLWGPAPSPLVLSQEAMPFEAPFDEDSAVSHRGDDHLRSVDEVIGYEIETSDGSLGHVDDFSLDDDNWSLRYVVVKTRNWLPGRYVLASPAWVGEVSWRERVARVDLTRSQLEAAPTYDPSQVVNRRYEERLYDYYGRPAYWSNG